MPVQYVDKKMSQSKVYELSCGGWASADGRSGRPSTVMCVGVKERLFSVVRTTEYSAMIKLDLKLTPVMEITDRAP
jgi:hypothetical protein